LLHWPPQTLCHIPLQDMAEAYAAYHRYHAKPAEILPPTPAPQNFLAAMMQRYPDTESH
jgi:hypothetical protein